MSGTGFPNQFFCDSWVVGFCRGRPWLAGRRIGKKSLDVGSQGAATNVSALRVGAESVLAIARPFSRWRSGLGLANTIKLQPGIADACARRSTSHAGIAVVSSRELDEQAGSVEASGCSGRISNGTNQTGDGSGLTAQLTAGRSQADRRAGLIKEEYETQAG